MGPLSSRVRRRSANRTLTRQTDVDATIRGDESSGGRSPSSLGVALSNDYPARMADVKDEPRSRSGSKASAGAESSAVPDHHLLLETSSGGGPVLLLPAELAASWTGAGGQDYERACAPDGYVQTKRGGVGTLSVGTGMGIVLSEELTTMWLPTADGGVVVRGPEVSGMTAREARKSLPKAGWKVVAPALELNDGRVVLFDAAAAGAADPLSIDADPEPIVVDVGAGTYDVSRAQKGLDDFVRLVRIASRAALSGPKPVTPARPPPAPPPVAPIWEWRSTPLVGVTPFVGVNRPRPAEGLLTPLTGHDGARFGAGRDNHQQFFRLERDEPLVPISEPGEFNQIALSADARSLYFLGGTRRVLEVPGSGTTRDGVVRFEARSRIASIATVGPDRVILSYARGVHLLDRPCSPWRVLYTLELGSRWDAVVQVIEEGPFVWADADPHIHFAAIFPDRLQLVQTTLRTKGGITVSAGRAFLFGRKFDDAAEHEITNLRAVHDSLA
jgi:hypothetical protein